MNTRFLQLHFLTSYPASLLNRDDAGFAKRMPFGGTTRTRISSQCQKRHWRTFDGAHALSEGGLPRSLRSRRIFEQRVYGPLVKEGVEEGIARRVTEALKDKVLGGKGGEAADGEGADAAGDNEALRTAQVVVLGEPEVEYLLGLARQVAAQKPDAKKVGAALDAVLGKDGKANLQALKHASGLEAALFGRMVTGDVLSQGDAALHVAHAFTVHAEAAESDYFSAVDELLAGTGEKGGGHINSQELTSGLFYGYVVVDVPLLISNLEGVGRKDVAQADKTLAATVVERLVHLVATVSPGAKLGSTAPYAYAHAVLVEAGNTQPRTLANAFLNSVRAQPDLLGNTYAALAAHVSGFDAMYGNAPRRRFAAMGATDALQKALGGNAPVSLPELARWAAAQVQEA